MVLAGVAVRRSRVARTVANGKRRNRPMATEPTAPRDWHRLFGRLLTDLFKGSPFAVELERELSVEQPFLHVVIPSSGPDRTSIVRRTVPHVLHAVISRRRPGRFTGRLPDGLDGLVAHNLFTLESHREWLDAWAVKELVAHYVAYRQVVSPCFGARRAARGDLASDQRGYRQRGGKPV